MATQAEKIQKIEQELQRLKDTLTKYGDMFNEDGFIDTDEQKQLDRMQETIKQAEARLNQLRSESGNPETNTTNPKVRGKHKGKYNYGKIAADLFKKGSIDTHEIDPNDVQQGYLGDCYFLAAIASVARADPNALKKLITDNGDGTYNVKLYVYNNFLSFSRSPKIIKVKPEFPLKADGTPAYANSGDKELWVMLLEKAYAQYEGSYEDIHGGRVDKAMGVLTGTNATVYNVSSYSEKEILQKISDAIKNGKPVAADSKDVKGDKKKAPLAQNLNIIGGHSYPVKSVSGNNISLQNPWTNVNTGNKGDNYDITISVTDFKKFFDDFNIKE